MRTHIISYSHEEQDSPISTPPVVSPFKHKGVVTAGRDRQQIQIIKENKPMSTVELSTIIEKLKEWEAIQAEAAAEVEALKDQIKAEMNSRGVEELERS